MLDHTIKELLSLKGELDLQVKKVTDEIKNSKASLDERWDAYEKLVSAGLVTQTKPYISDHVERLLKKTGKTGRASEVTLYDDFYIER